MTEQSGQHSEEEARKYAQLVANAWLDAEFNRRLRDNPAEVLREAGIEVPEGVEVKVVDPDQEVRRLRLPARPTFNFTLPPKPASLEEGLSDEQLRQAQAGMLPIFTTSRGSADCRGTGTGTGSDKCWSHGCGHGCQ